MCFDSSAGLGARNRTRMGPTRNPHPPPCRSAESAETSQLPDNNDIIMLTESDNHSKPSLLGEAWLRVDIQEGCIVLLYKYH